MTDLEISKALALAIGWKPSQMMDYGYVLWVDYDNGLCRELDYRDPAVIWPIAVKYNCFSYKTNTGEWNAISPANWEDNTADTPEKAVALAVIRSVK